MSLPPPGASRRLRPIPRREAGRERGKFFETTRTLEGYADLKSTFGACTSCHVRKPGSSKLTRKGEEFRQLVGDMKGLEAWMKEHHPAPPAAFTLPATSRNACDGTTNSANSAPRSAARHAFEPVGETGHDLLPLRFGHERPVRDFRTGASASDAIAGHPINHADLHARRRNIHRQALWTDVFIA